MTNQFKNIQDFLNDDDFVAWVLHSQNDSFWQNFINENPDKTTIIQEAKKLLEEIRSFEDTQSSKLNQNRVWAKLKESMQEETEIDRPKFRLFHSQVFRWAASVIFILGFIGTYFWMNEPKNVSYNSLVSSIEEKQLWVEYTNDKTTPKTISLEDGSSVILEKNSKISIPKHFEADKRTVILSGEAFFEIAKNPRRPFYVYANEVITKVLGTSFRVRAFENDKKITVKVKTGKVSVFSQNKQLLDTPESKGLILLPNQQAIYNRPTDVLSKHLVETPMPLLTNDATALPEYFDEQSVSNILEVIERRYGVKIIYDEELLSRCVITTRLRDESLYEQLDLICTIIGATYKEVDAQIVFESEGCQ
ncbi:FecR family protein [Emticicia oligotrophica]|uniref:FecR family protein n=1 Tax=Emticicia oligotrophica TaxID=312279 RepID=UPI00273B4903|nr:FecR family protein [Emticicia oligotrophica]